jgi:hypothetical protein
MDKNFKKIILVSSFLFPAISSAQLKDVNLVVNISPQVAGHCEGGLYDLNKKFITIIGNEDLKIDLGSTPLNDHALRRTLTLTCTYPEKHKVSFKMNGESSDLHEDAVKYQGTQIPDGRYEHVYYFTNWIK